MNTRIVFEGGDFLRLEYVPLRTCVLWDDNPKRHDVGGIIESIQEHGFKDPPKYEPELNDGKGGLGTGNGRMHCTQALITPFCAFLFKMV